MNIVREYEYVYESERARKWHGYKDRKTDTTEDEWDSVRIVYLGAVGYFVMIHIRTCKHPTEHWYSQDTRIYIYILFQCIGMMSQFDDEHVHVKHVENMHKGLILLLNQLLISLTHIRYRFRFLLSSLFPNTSTVYQVENTVYRFIYMHTHKRIETFAIFTFINISTKDTIWSASSLITPYNDCCLMSTMPNGKCNDFASNW